MAKITTLPAMRDYIYNQLGAPVITVEIATTQLDQIIEDSIELFNRYNYGEGSHKDYLVINLSADTQDYSLSGQEVNDVVDMLLSETTGGLNTLFTPINLFYNGQSPVSSSAYLSDYYTAMTHLKQITDTLSTQFKVDYIQSQEILRIVPTPEVDLVAMIEVYKKETAQYLYNHILVKQLCVAKAKILWGGNLGKYSMQLPGGGTINFSEIKSEGKEELERVMVDIKAESEPIDFFLG